MSRGQSATCVPCSKYLSIDQVTVEQDHGWISSKGLSDCSCAWAAASRHATPALLRKSELCCEQQRCTSLEINICITFLHYWFATPQRASCCSGYTASKAHMRTRLLFLGWWRHDTGKSFVPVLQAIRVCTILTRAIKKQCLITS